MSVNWVATTALRRAAVPRYCLAGLTCPRRQRSGVRRVGVVLGLDRHHGGGVELAAGRKRLGQALKVPFEAGGGVHLHQPRYGVAWVGEGMGDPVGNKGEAAGWAVSCRCSTVNTTVPSRTYMA